MSAASPSRLIEQRSSAQPSAAGRILVLASDSKSAEAIGRILKPHDFFVLSVDSSKNAIQALDADPTVDLVLLDAGDDSKHLLPLIKQINQRNFGPTQAAILLLTSAEDVSRAIQAIHLGAYDYLAKPFGEQQLLAAVRRVVEYRRLRVQNDLFRHHLEQMIAARTKMLQNTMQQLEQSYDITLEALGNALDLKDAETEGHSKRVTAYTLALGRAVGLREPELRVVGRGAFLHDIGKMAIPDAILRKPGKLTAEEQVIMRTHSELGYRMIRKIPYLREAAEIVYSHQECYDGSGYPRGLRGEQIHIGARIFALADTLDAITSNRPYRKANTIEWARKEVLRCAGTQFDPSLVDVFVTTPESIWQDLREGIMRDGPEFSPFGYTFGEVRIS
jgi:putative nucleotidyltransferase with HDIG domain